jgi:hypothetical protein
MTTSPRRQKRRGKPQRDYQAEYRARKAKAKREGRSTAEARGHASKIVEGRRVGEYELRRKRELTEKLETGKLTSSERSALRAFVRKHVNFRATPARKTQIEELVLSRARERPGLLAAMRTQIKTLAQQAKGERKAKVVRLGGRARRREVMELFAAEWGLPDWRLLFY